MSYETWPESLPPSFMLDGLSGEEPDVTIREDMDVGPTKVRPRYTAASEPISGQILLQDETQLATLRSFYRTTLIRGSLPFNWIDPRDGLPGVFRFVGGYSWENWEGRWLVSFQAEKLPV